MKRRVPPPPDHISVFHIRIFKKKTNSFILLCHFVCTSVICINIHKLFHGATLWSSFQLHFSKKHAFL